MGLGLRTFAFFTLGFGKKIPSIPASQFFTEQHCSIALAIGKEVSYGTSLYEELLLVALAVHSQSRVVFEFGSFLGQTSYNLARNIPGTVYTLDLPGNSAKKYWSGKPEASRISQILGDSEILDFSKLYGQMDLVFVDGAHTYRGARKDSDTALKLLAKSGMVVWHDYAPCWPGVIRALHELSDRIPLVHIAGTSLVVYLRNIKIDISGRSA